MLDFKKALQWAIMLCSFVLVLFTAGCANDPPQSLSTDNLDSGSVKDELYDVAVVESRVVYENVEMYRYAGTDGHPYIHDIKTNNTSKNIVGCKRGMLAYDKNGQPLKVDWYTLDQSLDQTFYYLCDWDTFELLSGETDDKFGGWSLNYWGDDLAADE